MEPMLRNMQVIAAYTNNNEELSSYNEPLVSLSFSKRWAFAIRSGHHRSCQWADEQCAGHRCCEQLAQYHNPSTRRSNEERARNKFHIFMCRSVGLRRITSLRILPAITSSLSILTSLTMQVYCLLFRSHPSRFFLFSCIVLLLLSFLSSSCSSLVLFFFFLLLH